MEWGFFAGYNTTCHHGFFTKGDREMMMLGCFFQARRVTRPAFIRPMLVQISARDVSMYILLCRADLFCLQTKPPQDAPSAAPNNPSISPGGSGPILS